MILKPSLFRYFNVLKSFNNCRNISACTFKLTIPQYSISLIYDQKRFKYNKKAKNTKEAEESDDDTDQEDGLDAQSKLVKGHMQSLRADAVIKAGLGIARNKVELTFYESRIRINGCKLLKKSLKLNIKDEIDVIKGVSRLNSDFLTISRIVIVNARENEEGDGIVVTMRRFKSMDVENYPNEHQWTE